MDNQTNVITINGNRYVRDSFTYVLNVAALGFGATADVSVNIEADSSFTIVKTAYMTDLAGAAQTDSTRVVPLITVQLRDTGSGRSLQNQAVNLSSLAGTGELPFVWPVPRYFAPSSTIQATFANYSVATDYANVSLALIGYKMFRL